MTLPLTTPQWALLAVLLGLILLDAVLAWFKYAAHGKFNMAKFALFIRKQFYVVGAGILVAVVHKYGPIGTKSITSAIWWSGALGVALQYVFGDILGTKLGIIKFATNGMSSSPPAISSKAEAAK